MYHLNELVSVIISEIYIEKKLKWDTRYMRLEMLSTYTYVAAKQLPIYDKILQQFKKYDPIIVIMNPDNHVPKAHY